MVLPDEEKYSTTRNEMLDQLAYMLGGRAAEEMVFHDPTTGAANDIEKATGVARAMVTQYGMTERLGAIRYGSDQTEVFLGRDMGHQRDYSGGDRSRDRRGGAQPHRGGASGRLRDPLRQPRRAGFPGDGAAEKETLNKEQVAAIFEPIRRRPARPAWTGSARRQPSSQGPVAIPDRPRVTTDGIDAAST